MKKAMNKQAAKGKKPYKKMTITAVPLKPEQAILSCCNSTERGPRIPAVPTTQCYDFLGGCPGGSGSLTNS